MISCSISQRQHTNTSSCNQTFHKCGESAMLRAHTEDLAMPNLLYYKTGLGKVQMETHSADVDRRVKELPSILVLFQRLLLLVDTALPVTTRICCVQESIFVGTHGNNSNLKGEHSPNTKTCRKKDTRPGIFLQETYGPDSHRSRETATSCSDDSPYVHKVLLSRSNYFRFNLTKCS